MSVDSYQRSPNSSTGDTLQENDNCSVQKGDHFSNFQKEQKLRQTEKALVKALVFARIVVTRGLLYKDNDLNDTSSREFKQSIKEILRRHGVINATGDVNSRTDGCTRGEDVNADKPLPDTVYITKDTPVETMLFMKHVDFAVDDIFAERDTVQANHSKTDKHHQALVTATVVPLFDIPDKPELKRAEEKMKAIAALCCVKKEQAEKTKNARRNKAEKLQSRKTVSLFSSLISDKYDSKKTSSEEGLQGTESLCSTDTEGKSVSMTQSQVRNSDGDMGATEEASEKIGIQEALYGYEDILESLRPGIWSISFDDNIIGAHNKVSNFDSLDGSQQPKTARTDKAHRKASKYMEGSEDNIADKDNALAEFVRKFLTKIK